MQLGAACLAGDLVANSIADLAHDGAGAADGGAIAQTRIKGGPLLHGARVRLLFLCQHGALLERFETNVVACAKLHPRHDHLRSARDSEDDLLPA